MTDSVVLLMGMDSPSWSALVLWALDPFILGTAPEAAVDMFSRKKSSSSCHIAWGHFRFKIPPYGLFRTKSVATCSCCWIRPVVTKRPCPPPTAFNQRICRVKAGLSLMKACWCLVSAAILALEGRMRKMTLCQLPIWYVECVWVKLYA